jgi:hypothetical protein
MVIDNSPGCRNAKATDKGNRRVKPVTSRLRKSKNFWKEDRCLDDYIDRNKSLKSGEKLLLKKLIKLRTNEDSNVVKVTKSGLSKLLDVNIKTIRDWLRKLIRKGFLIDDGDVWDPHCNFPKHKYSFPVTFPGFDSATVFIQRNAKAKYAQKMTPKRLASKQRKISSYLPKTTCPVVPRLLDCSNSSPNVEEIETCNSFFQKEITLPSTAFAQKRPRETTSISRRAPKQKDVLNLLPGLTSLLQGVLTSMKVKGKMKHVSRYINRLLQENGRFKTREDLLDLADNLYQDITIGWIEEEIRRKSLSKLFRFLRLYIIPYCPRSFFRTEEYYAAMVYNFQMLETEEEFFQEFPFCKRKGGWHMRPD